MDWDSGNCGDLGGIWKRKDVPSAERKGMLLVYCNYCTGLRPARKTYGLISSDVLVDKLYSRKLFVDVSLCRICLMTGAEYLN